MLRNGISPIEITLVVSKVWEIDLSKDATKPDILTDYFKKTLTHLEG